MFRRPILSIPAPAPATAACAAAALGSCPILGNIIRCNGLGCFRGDRLPLRRPALRFVSLASRWAALLLATATFSAPRSLVAWLLAALTPLLRHAASAASDGLRATLTPWLALEQPPSMGRAALAAWRGIAALLLTKQGEWRKRVAKPEGFGPEHAGLRDRLRGLLEELQPLEALRAALHTVASLPEARYTDAQWSSLAALRVVLVRLAAELKVAFAERRAVDFVELALSAQHALGQVDAPSELLLALDALGLARRVALHK